MAKRQSAIHRRKGLVTNQSALELSALVRREIGIDIEPKKLATFICARFTILSMLCHEIHEAEATP